MDVVVLTLMAITVVSLYFSQVYNSGYNIADEGYLWYGTLRLLKKEVPIRDFRAYDPGKYLWCGLGCKAFGKGLIGIRMSQATFTLITLFLAGRIILEVHHDWILVLLSLATLILWLGTNHR